MALYKNKWEIKSWAELSASVADASNALEFRPKHRLPHKLQQGAKASKKTGGSFNRESIIKSTDYPGGYFIYDTGSGLSYTAIPKDPWKLDLTAFLNSSSLSAAAKTTLSSSFNSASWPDIVVQIDEADTAPATASWTVPTAFIGDAASTLQIINTSTNTTNLTLKSAGTYITGSVEQVEFTLPMETMSFTGTFASRSIKFSAFTGSDYSSAQYANSAIYTPHGSSQTTASIIGTIWGSGSFNSHPRGLYDHIEYEGYIKALGDGPDAIYAYSGKTPILHFATGSVVTSSVFSARYAVSDTSMSGAFVTGTVYYVSGSLTSTGSEHFWDNTLSDVLVNTQDSGSHLFADAGLTTPASEGIYKFAGLTNPSGSLVIFPTSNIQTNPRVPRFSGQKY